MSDPQPLTYRERWGHAAALQSAVLRRLRRWLGLRVYGIYVKPLAWDGEPDPSVPGLRVRLFKSGDADALLAHARSAELDLSDAFVRDALGKGDVCLAALADDAIVAYTWSAFSPTHDDDGVFAGFGETYRYVYKAFTRPDYRGRHLFRVFAPVRDRYCVTVRGCSRSIAYIDLDNHSSIHLALSMGHRRVGTAGYLKCGPLFWPFASGGAREHRFRFFMPAKSPRS